MVDKVVDNFNKEDTSIMGFWTEDTTAGVGSQFVLYSAAVISKLEVKMYKSGAPTGTVKARLFTSTTNIFRDKNDYANSLIAESTDLLDLDDLTGAHSTVSFTFNNVALAAGIYFVCLYSVDFVRNDGGVYVLTSASAISSMGYGTFWWSAEGRWGSWVEWD